MLKRLLNKIVVHETIDAGHVRHLSIEIHVNFKQLPVVECYTTEEQRLYKTRLERKPAIRKVLSLTAS